MNEHKTDLLSRFRLDGQVAIVTGGASGIGLATAKLFASAGAHVVIVDLNENAAREAAQEIHSAKGLASSYGVDVSDESAIERVFNDVVEQQGRIDVLVCNAAIGGRTPALELSLEKWNRLMSVNLTGVFLCARAAARHMVISKRGGSIVITTSIMGLSGGGFGANIDYQTAKGGLVNMTRGLAVEWADHGIRVNAIAPGWIRTPMTGSWDEDPERLKRIDEWVPLKRLGEPEDVATAMLFLSSPAASMITGHTLPVDGGFLAK